MRPSAVEERSRSGDWEDDIARLSAVQTKTPIEVFYELTGVALTY